MNARPHIRRAFATPAAPLPKAWVRAPRAAGATPRDEIAVGHCWRVRLHPERPDETVVRVVAVDGEKLDVDVTGIVLRVTRGQFLYRLPRGESPR